MHIKHYHPEMCKFFGDTPNVADLAYARIVVDEPSPTSKTVDRYAGNIKFHEICYKLINIVHILPI